MRRTEIPEYKVWLSMRARCNNPNNKGYKNYGGRGITVCKEWNDFENFMNDMGPRLKGLSIDRIDNDKGYSPENCRWATRVVQNTNKRTTIMVLYGDELISLVQACKEVGMNVPRARRNLIKGLPWDDTSNKRKPIFFEYQGRKISAKEAAEITGLHKFTLIKRYKNGEANPLSIEHLNKGERTSKAKLKESDVRRIKELIRSGKPQKDISRLYGVDRTTISNIKTGDTWSWV